MMRLGSDDPARHLFSRSTVDAAVHIRRKFELPIFRDEGPDGGGHGRRFTLARSPLLHSSSVNLHLKKLGRHGSDFAVRGY